MSRLKARIDELEKRTKGPGRIVVVGAGIYDASENEAAYRQAIAETGPGDEVGRIQYVHNWGLPEDTVIVVHGGFQGQEKEAENDEPEMAARATRTSGTRV